MKSQQNRVELVTRPVVGSIVGLVVVELIGVVLVVVVGLVVRSDVGTGVGLFVVMGFPVGILGVVATNVCKNMIYTK